MTELEQWGKENCDEFIIITVGIPILFGKKGDIHFQKSESENNSFIEQTTEKAIYHIETYSKPSAKSIYEEKIYSNMIEYYNKKITIQELKENIENLYQERKIQREYRNEKN